MFHLRNNV